MTTPTYPSKRFYAAGVKKAGAWGTAEALGAGFGVLIESDGNPVPKRAYTAREDIDAVMPLDGDLGLIEPVDFSPEFAMRYDPGPLGSFIAGLFGVAGVPAPVFEVIAGTNNKINVKEGAGLELTATVAAGTYSGATLATAIAAALNAIVGKTLVWTCTYASATNKFTIGVATSTCDLLFATGANHLVDISVLCGYAETDLTGGTSYVSDATGVGTAQKHVFTWADSIASFFTFGVERPGTVWEVPSCVPFKLDLKPAAGVVKGTISLRGNNLVAGGVNGATEMDALTYADVANRVRFAHGSFWMNAQSGGALSAGDALQISDMDISYERSLDGVHCAGDEGIVQSQDAKGFKMSLKLTLPRTSAANLAYLTTFNAMTAQKLLVTFTSTINAGGGVKYSLTLGFPRLKFVEPPAAPLADAMSTVITLEAEQAATGPTGMTAYVRPYVELVNLQATDYLA